MAKAKPQINPQVPGEIAATPEAATAPAETTAAAAAATSTEGDENAAANPPAPASAETELDETEAKEEATPVAKSTPVPAANTGLPDAKDIDPAKITRSVLTKQGWVVPSAQQPHPAQKF